MTLKRKRSFQGSIAPLDFFAMQSLLSLAVFLYVQETVEPSPVAERRGSLSSPDIGVNGLFLYRKGSSSSSTLTERPNGFSIQEIETILSASVDPYFRGQFNFSFEFEPDASSGKREARFHPEEAFAETLSIPYVTFRIGKFNAFFGRHNQLHTHAWPFIDPPLIYDVALGEEGLNEVGLAASMLIPFPWYSEVTAQAFSAQNENLFEPSSADNLAGVFQLKNFWELSEIVGLEIDGSFGLGNNSFNSKTYLYDMALIFKWGDLAQRAKAPYISFTTEALRADLQKDGQDNEAKNGLSSWIQIQPWRRFWLQTRGDLLGNTKNISAKKTSALIGFVPTEFSSLRAQYDLQKEEGLKAEHRISLQLNISIGAHPAHQY
jgi:hypothetical protein